MATSDQFPGKGASTGTGKDPRASTALPGASKQSAPLPRQGGGGGGISPGKIIIGGTILLIVLVVANVGFLSLQKDKAKAETEFDLSGNESEIKAKLAELSIQVSDLKQLQIEQKKEIDRMKAELKSNRNQIDFLSSRELSRPK